jgi:mRNA interferase YafQ
MRRIERTNAFRRDYKREMRGQHRRDVEDLITLAVSLLAEDKPLPKRTVTTRLPANGMIFANAILSPIS